MAFPNVPIAPGVPALLRDPLTIAAAVALLTADLISPAQGAAGGLWGIFLDGEPVVTAETVVALDYKQDWTISDYPIEDGGFESYDKVEAPFHVRIRFGSGESDAARQGLLDSIAAIAKTLDLYDVYTPEAVYQSVNVQHYDFRRSSSNGVGLIIVDVWCTQVRVTAVSTFSSTKSPSGANAVNHGQVTAQTPNQVVQTDFASLEIQ